MVLTRLLPLLLDEAVAVDADADADAAVRRRMLLVAAVVARVETTGIMALQRTVENKTKASRRLL